MIPVNKTALLKALLGLLVLIFGTACGGGGGGGGTTGGGSIGGAIPQTPIYFSYSNSGAVTLGWQSASSNTPNERYRLYRKFANQPQFTLLNESPSRSYTDYQVIAGLTYQYYVTAVAGTLESPPTEWVTLTPRFNGIGQKLSDFVRITAPQQDIRFIRAAPDNAGGYYILNSTTNPHTLARMTSTHVETSRTNLTGILEIFEMDDGRSAILTSGGLQIASEATSPGVLSPAVAWPATGMMTSFQALIPGYDANPIVITQVGSARATSQGTFSNFRSGGGSSSPILCGDASGQFAHRVEMTSPTQAHIRRWTDSSGWSTTTIPIPNTLVFNSAEHLCGTLQLLDGRIAVIGIERRDPLLRCLACYFVSTNNVVSSPTWLDTYGPANTEPYNLRFRYRTSSARGWRSTTDRDYSISVMRSPNGDVDIAWRKEYDPIGFRAADFVVSRLDSGANLWRTIHRVPSDLGNGPMSASRNADAGYIVCWGPGALPEPQSASGHPTMALRRWHLSPSGELSIQHAAGLPNGSAYTNGVLGWVRPSGAMAVAIMNIAPGGSSTYALDCALLMP